MTQVTARMVVIKDNGMARKDFSMGSTTVSQAGAMLTLPGDGVRQIQWRFADRFDLQMLVQSARGGGARYRWRGWLPPANAIRTSGLRRRAR